MAGATIVDCSYGIEAPDNTVTLHTLSVTCGASFCIVVSMNTIPVECLIDTGAAISLLHGNVWTKITTGGLAQPLQEWTGQTLVGINGNKLSVRGYSQILISVKGKQFNGKFIVMDNIKVDAILGLDFLKENRCMMDCGKRFITFPPKEFSLAAG